MASRLSGSGLSSSYSELSLSSPPSGWWSNLLSPPQDDPVVIGLACRVPDASNATQLWSNVKIKDFRQKVPADRFNWCRCILYIILTGRIYFRYQTVQIIFIFLDRFHVSHFSVSSLISLMSESGHNAQVVVCCHKLLTSLFSCTHMKFKLCRQSQIGEESLRATGINTTSQTSVRRMKIKASTFFFWHSVDIYLSISLVCLTIASTTSSTIHLSIATAIIL
jgi:hypothetical protein